MVALCPKLPFTHIHIFARRVTSVAYNPFHDQLIASGSSDGRVDLWRVSSISSAPLLELGDDEEVNSGSSSSSSAAGADAGSADGSSRRRPEPKLAADAAIRVHEDHDETVTGVSWSAHDAWVYASLSYTGKVVVAPVPSAEKYKILL
jgi:WD40 repeat protein